MCVSVNCVWDYFLYQIEWDESVCHLTESGTRVCQLTVSETKVCVSVNCEWDQCVCQLTVRGTTVYAS